MKGPFLPEQITRNILLGRIHPDDHLSPDEVNWQDVSQHRELYPDVMQNNFINKDELEIATIQADERVSDQRREKEQMAQERRRTRDRRGSESDTMITHRENRKELIDIYKSRLNHPKVPTLSIIFSVIVIIVFGFVLNPEKENITVNCANPAKIGVNWSNCSFIHLNLENQNMKSSVLKDAILNEAKLFGVNLSDSELAYIELRASDLSYANLEGSRLTGANLEKADLRYANLKDADFSYADLTGAKLAGANTNNTRFDNTIWMDGHVCSKGSIGSCQ